MNINYICTILALLVSVNTFAQKLVPSDSKLRKGKLANGMTYYIRYNNDLPGHADFHIFHSVGAIQEEDNQNGLAHFLEHMAFKGTTHLPGNKLLDYMEVNGVKFGPNLNAATSLDYTHYMLHQIPTNRQTMIDTCMLVLSDWSAGITASQEAIDFERGVIREEYRTRSDLSTRINTALTPYYFKGSKYTSRNVIGDMDIISNFKREELLDFYHKWYRPELQAIAIVGDIDVEKVEKKIISDFSNLPNYGNTVKVSYPLPDNHLPIIAKYHDVEIANPSISILYKHRKKQDNHAGSVDNFVDAYINKIVVKMMNTRWQEIAEKSDNKVNNLSYSYGDFIADQDVFAIGVDLKTEANTWEQGFEQALYETNRFQRLGFVDTELDRATSEFAKQLERMKAESNKIPTNRIIQSYLQNFINGTPVPSIDYQYKVYKGVLDTLSLSTVNNRLRSFFRDDNQIITILSSKRDSTMMLSEDAVISGFKNMKNLPVVAYANIKTEELTPKNMPKGSKIIKEEKSNVGSTKLTLANGVEITLLPTKHKQDEILLTGFRPGGRSTVSDAELQSSYMLTSHMSNAGVGKLDANGVKNALSKHIVYVTPFLSEYDEGFSCTSSPNDLETMLKLIYMHCTEAKFDQNILQRDIDRFAENMSSRPLNPMAKLQDTVMLARGNYHPRSLSYIQDTSAIKLSQIQHLHEVHFGNPAGFKWIMTGNIDISTVKPLLEKYLGALPGKPVQTAWKDLQKRSPKGVKVIDFETKMESPKSITFMEYTKVEPFSLTNLVGIRILKNIVDIRLKALLRDDKSGVYTTDGEGSISENPVDELHFIVSFTSDPERMDELTATTLNELKRLSKEGIEETDLLKSKEYMQKIYKSQLESNHYWQSVLYSIIQSGRDKHSEMLRTIEDITAQEVNQLLQQIIASNNLVHVTMRPEAKVKGVIFEGNLNWNEILRKAKKENKHIFVDCYTTWCGPCKQMAEQVFPLEKMGDYFNPNFVNVKIQMDRTDKDNTYIQSWYSTADSLAKEYTIKSYPTFLIFKPNGELVHRIVAGDDADRFIAKVELGLNDKTAFYPMLKRFEGGDRSPVLLRDLTQGYKNIYNKDKVNELVKLYFKTRVGDPSAEDLEYAMTYCEGIQSESFAFVRKHKKIAVKYFGEDRVNTFFVGHIMFNEIYSHFKTGMDEPVVPLLEKAQRKYPDVSLKKEGLRVQIRQLRYKKDEAGLDKAINEFRNLYPNEEIN